MEAYLKTFSDRTIRNIFWSTNNYGLPKCPAKIGTKIAYWYGDDDRRIAGGISGSSSNIFLRRAFTASQDGSCGSW